MKTERIHIRITAEEKAALQDIAKDYRGGMTAMITAMIRATIYQGEVKPGDSEASL